MEDLQELLHKSGDLRCELVVVADTGFALRKASLLYVQFGFASTALHRRTPTGCSTQRTLERFVQLHGLLSNHHAVSQCENPRSTLDERLVRTE